MACGRLGGTAGPATTAGPVEGRPGPDGTGDAVGEDRGRGTQGQPLAVRWLMVQMVTATCGNAQDHVLSRRTIPPWAETDSTLLVGRRPDPLEQPAPLMAVPAFLDPGIGPVSASGKNGLISSHSPSVRSPRAMASFLQEAEPGRPWSFAHSHPSPGAKGHPTGMPSICRDAKPCLREEATKRDCRGRRTGSCPISVSWGIRRVRSGRSTTRRRDRTPMKLSSMPVRGGRTGRLRTRTCDRKGAAWRAQVRQAEIRRQWPFSSDSGATFGIWARMNSTSSEPENSQRKGLRPSR
jgi:hypothetical protein